MLRVKLIFVSIVCISLCISCSKTEEDNAKSELKEHLMKLDYNPNDCVSAHQASLIYQYLEELDLAVTYGEKAVVNCHSEAQVIFDLGISHFLIGDFLLAESYFDKSVKLADDDEKAFFSRRKEMWLNSQDIGKEEMRKGTLNNSREHRKKPYRNLRKVR